MVSRAYVFRPMTAADLPSVRRWLAKPHVARWWGNPDEQFALVSRDLLGEDLDRARGIDQFIGEEDMIDCGHGSALIRAFVDDLLRAGAPQVLTDPSPANTRAIRAYEKAGFRRDRPVSTPDGEALLMVREPNGT